VHTNYNYINNKFKIIWSWWSG